MIPEEETKLCIHASTDWGEWKESEIDCFQYAVPVFGITPTLPFDQLALSLGLEAFRLELLRGGFRVMLWVRDR